MIEAYYNFAHSIGLHLFTIPSIIVGVLLIAVVAGQYRRNKADKEPEASGGKE